MSHLSFEKVSARVIAWGIRWLLPFFGLAWSCLCLMGCNWIPHRSPPPKASVSLPGGLESSAGAPEQAAGPTTQAVTRHTVRTYQPALSSGWTTNVQAPASQAPSPAPPMVREEITETATASIPGVHKDESREITAKMDAQRPMQYLGAALIIGAALMFYPPIALAVGAGKQMQAALGIGGLVLVMGPQLLAGNERLILGFVGGGLVLVYGVSRLSYKEGRHDESKAPSPPLSPAA